MRVKDTATFIQKANGIHQGAFTYEKVDYQGAKAKVEVTCPVHGGFLITPTNHLSGRGCKKCGDELKSKKMRMSRSGFVNQANKVHGDKYDYSDSVYVNTRTEVKINCPEHGPFWQIPDNHLQGKGCPHCGAEDRKPKFKTQTEFEEQAQEVHGNRYSYKGYLSSLLPVTIICPDHGEFEQTPSNHLRGAGCPHCWSHRRKYDNPMKWTTEDCINKFRLVHGDRYDYSDVVYRGKYTPVTIYCKKHGKFEQAPNNHFNGGHNCPRCATRISKGEQELADFLTGMNLPVEQQRRIEGKAFDIVVEDVAIEYLGIYWHSTGVLTREEAQAQGKNRRLLANTNGFRYIAIYEDEWMNTPDKVKDFLRNVFGKSERIGARKLTVTEVSSKEARGFYDRHHLLGAGNAAGHHMALMDGDCIAACMTISKATENRGVKRPRLSLSRFCTDGRNIIGAASRLFRHFNLDCDVVSYIDLDKFEGGVYELLGFKKHHDLDPDYWAVWPPMTRRHKTSVKKDNLKKLDGFDPDLTEYENTQHMGLYRVYHSGRVCVMRKGGDHA